MFKLNKQFFFINQLKKDFLVDFSYKISFFGQFFGPVLDPFRDLFWILWGRVWPYWATFGGLDCVGALFGASGVPPEALLCASWGS